MPSNFWHEFLVYISPAVVALLLAIAKWVESRARITLLAEQSISAEIGEISNEEQRSREQLDSGPVVPGQRKSSTRETISTSPGEEDDAEGSSDGPIRPNG